MSEGDALIVGVSKSAFLVGICDASSLARAPTTPNQRRKLNLLAWTGHSYSFVKNQNAKTDIHSFVHEFAEPEGNLVDA
jgi:hypothetical protein